MKREFKTIKAMFKPNFEVSLLRDADDIYVVEYKNSSYGETKQSENIRDFHLASYVFDVKVADMEGQ
jgi:hypothetical protein